MFVLNSKNGLNMSVKIKREINKGYHTFRIPFKKLNCDFTSKYWIATRVVRALSSLEHSGTKFSKKVLPFKTTEDRDSGRSTTNPL